MSVVRLEATGQLPDTTQERTGTLEGGVSVVTRSHRSLVACPEVRMFLGKSSNLVGYG